VRGGAGGRNKKPTYLKRNRVRKLRLMDHRGQIQQNEGRKEKVMKKWVVCSPSGLLSKGSHCLAGGGFGIKRISRGDKVRQQRSPWEGGGKTKTLIIHLSGFGGKEKRRGKEEGDPDSNIIRSKGEYGGLGGAFGYRVMEKGS